MRDEEKLYQAYYQLDRLWTGGKAIKELYKVTSKSKTDIKSILAKRAIWQVHIPHTPYPLPPPAPHTYTQKKKKEKKRKHPQNQLITPVSFALHAS